ncbi:MAG: hypothetical protein C4K60_11520 [Ideonella sp. MAG2]|nr:MAG: hypothetical protein C4K60_11520 [Ideonella sp. MAG2]
MAVKSASSPILGAKVEVSADSLDGAERLGISYEEGLPGPLNADALALGGRAISKTLVLTRTGSADFGQAVAVTLPYDKAALPADGVPIVVHWDDASKRYSPVTIRKIDRAAGTITFMTAHFSKYVAIILDKLAGATPPPATSFSTDTGFDPSVDGFFDRNFGSYDSPGGLWYLQHQECDLGLVRVCQL